MAITLTEIQAILSLRNEMSPVLQKVTGDVTSAVKEMTLSWGVVAAAVGAVTGAIVALGVKGAEINDVSDTLKRFAGSSEEAAAVMDKLRAGTQGVVDDFDLTREAAHLLSTGVKLTADDFGTLGEAAFVMQNRGLGSTKEQLEAVSDALVTGRTRALAMRLGVVEIKDAELEYANKLGIVKGELSSTQIAEAHREAVMRMLNAAVKDAGAQHRDFGEQLDFAKTKVINFVDRLASAVAASPPLNQAMADIGKAIMNALGGDSQAAIQKIVGWINALAREASAMAPSVTTALTGVKNLFQFLSDNAELLKTGAIVVGSYAAAWLVFNTGSALVSGVSAGFKAIEGSLVSAQVAGGPFLIAIGAIAAALVLLKQQADGEAKTMGDFSQAQRTAAAGGADLRQKLGESTDAFHARVEAAAAAVEAHKKVTESTGPLVAGLSLTVDTTHLLGLTQAEEVEHARAQKKALDDAGEAARKHQEAIKAAAAAVAEHAKKLADVNQKIADATRDTGTLTDANERSAMSYDTLGLSAEEIGVKLGISGLAVKAFLDGLDQTDKSIIAFRSEGVSAAQAVGDGLRGMPNVLMELAQAWGDVRLGAHDLKGELPGIVDGYAAARTAIVDAMDAGLRSALPLNAEQKVLIAQMARLGFSAQEMARLLGISFNQAADAARHFSASFKDLGPAIIGAFQGGGDVGKTIGGTIGKDIGAGLAAEIPKSAGKLLSAFGTMLGPLGALAGGLIGSLVGKLFGDPEKQVNPVRQAFVDAAGGLDKLNHSAFDATGSLRLVQDMLNAKNPKDYKTAIDALNDALKTHAAIVAQTAQLDGLRLQLGAQQIQNANDVIAVLDEQVKAYDALATQIDAAKQAGKNFDDLLAQQRGTITATAADLHGLAVVAVASFAAAIASGMSWGDAIRAAAPGITTLRKAFDELGISTDNELFAALALQTAIVSANPTLVRAVGALGDSFAALAQFGQLNVATFAEMQRTGYDMYVRLQAAAAAQGGSTRDALLPMQDYLHKAEAAARELGIPLDDNTQMLIDQSKELGIWKEAGKSATDKIIDQMVLLVKTIQDLVDHLAKIHDVSFTVTQHNKTDGGGSDGGSDGGDGTGTTPTLPEASGGTGRTTGPTLFYSGGDEDFAFSGEGRSFGSGGDGGDVVDVVAAIASLRSDLAASRRQLPSLMAAAVKDAIVVARAR